MNSVNIFGRLTKDIELKQGNISVGKFTIAIDKKLSKAKKEEFKAQGKATADFINVVCFGRVAEIVAHNFSKGKQIPVSGSITTGTYKKNDGSIGYSTEVLMESFDFVDGNGTFERATQEAPEEAGFQTISEEEEDNIPF